MKKRGLKDQKAQRANMRATDNKQQFMQSLQNLQRKRICQLDEEMMVIRRDLMNMNSHQPNYFLEPSRPNSARQSSSARPTTAPETRDRDLSRHVSRDKDLSRGNSRELVKKASAGSLQSQISQNSDRSRGGNGKGPVASLDQCPEAVATASSRWKKGNTRVKLGAVQIMARSHQEAKKRIESKQDFSASAELDTIKSISKWLSIKNMAEQPRGIPPIAMRYVHSRHKDWKFDLPTFMEKQFPPPKSKTEFVPEEIMEEQKKCFNNMTAARALLKFKRRLNTFRAKTEEERQAEKMWEDLKKVRYLRIPGQATEARFYSYTPDLGLSRPDSMLDDYMR